MSAETLVQRIAADTRAAMKDQDVLRLSTLRLLTSSIRNKEIEERGKGQTDGLTDEEALAVVRSEVKKRRDAIEGFRSGGREDMARKEEAELALLDAYLPAELPDDKIEQAVRAVIARAGTPGPGDFGRIMGEAMRELKGKASGDRVSVTVKRLLG